MASKGGILIKPTSVDKTGASSTATINTNGSVTFGLCVTLSLNGVFSSDYDNYMIVMRHTGSDASNFNIDLRFRLSGSDATGSNYTFQYIVADSTSVAGARATSQSYMRISSSSNVQRYGLIANVYGPFLAQPTAVRSTPVEGINNAQILDFAGTHSLSTSYDGLTLSRNSGSFTGLVAVYGMRK